MTPPAVRLIRLPGVFKPISDSRMLAECVRQESAAGMRMLDLCTGTGLLALTAAKQGAEVTAVDVSGAAVLNVRLNARINSVGVEVLRGDLFAPVAGRTFDLIASNPPYVPAAESLPPGRGARAWWAGSDGRLVIDRICAAAADHLRPGGRLVLVHSHLCGIAETLDRLRSAGLAAETAEVMHGPLGPLMTAQAPQLERIGLLAREEREETVAVIRATEPNGPARRQGGRPPAGGRSAQPSR